MNEAAPKHQSYLLRLWQPTKKSGPLATLIPIGKHQESCHFASLEALFLFLSDSQSAHFPEQTAEEDGTEI